MYQSGIYLTSLYSVKISSTQLTAMKFSIHHMKVFHPYPREFPTACKFSPWVQRHFDCRSNHLYLFLLQPKISLRADSTFGRRKRRQGSHQKRGTFIHCRRWGKARASQSSRRLAAPLLDGKFSVGCHVRPVPLIWFTSCSYSHSNTISIHPSNRSLFIHSKRWLHSEASFDLI